MWNGAANVCFVTGMTSISRTGEPSKKIIIYGCSSSLLSQDIVVCSITMDTIHYSIKKHLLNTYLDRVNSVAHTLGHAGKAELAHVGLSCMVKVIDMGLEMNLEVVSCSDVMGRNVCFVNIIPH